MSGTITNITTSISNPKNRDMFRSLLILFPVLSVTALMLGSPQSVSAAEFHVSGGNSQALIQAIKDANANAEADVIHLGAGVYTLTKVESEHFDVTTVTDPDGTVRVFNDYIYGPNGLPFIESDITVRAASGPVVIERNGDMSLRFFHVFPGATLRLEGVTLRGGKSDGGRNKALTGGAILNEGAVVIRDSVFKDNVAGTEGGAINNRPHAFLEIHTSTFEHNTLNQWNPQGGALGGAIINVAGLLKVDRSTFKGNTTCLPPACETEDGDGGAIENVAGEAIITNSTFVENKSVSGGAIENARGKLTIVNSTFYKNVATRWAGAIGAYADNSPSLERATNLWGEGIIVIINSTIVGNHAGDDGIGKDGYNTFGGGGILTQKGVIVLKNTILAGNTAPAGMPQDCTGYPYFHDNPVYIISAGNNIIGDTNGCLTVPVEMPWKGTHTHHGKPLLVTLKTGSPTDMTGNPDVGSYGPDPSAPGRGHFPLNSNSPAINNGDNDPSVKLNSPWVGGHVCATPDISHDQLGNTVALEVRDIGAVEYMGASPAPVTWSSLNNLSPFATGDVDCSKQVVFVSTGAAIPGADTGGGTGGGAVVSPGTDVVSNPVSNIDVDEVAQAVDSDVKASTGVSSGGGGALEPWGMLLGILAIGARLRRQRVMTVLGN